MVAKQSSRRVEHERSMNSVDELDGKPSIMFSIKEGAEHALSNENLNKYEQSKRRKKVKV